MQKIKDIIQESIDVKTRILADDKILQTIQYFKNFIKSVFNFCLMQRFPESLIEENLN